MMFPPISLSTSQKTSTSEGSRESMKFEGLVLEDGPVDSTLKSRCPPTGSASRPLGLITQLVARPTINPVPATACGTARTEDGAAFEVDDRRTVKVRREVSSDPPPNTTHPLPSLATRESASAPLLTTSSAP